MHIIKPKTYTKTKQQTRNLRLYRLLVVRSLRCKILRREITDTVFKEGQARPFFKTTHNPQIICENVHDSKRSAQVPQCISNIVTQAQNES